MSQDVIRCVCGQKENDGTAMVQCDGCYVWQHTECVGFEEDPESELVREYFCERCTPGEHWYLVQGYETYQDYKEHEERDKANKRRQKRHSQSGDLKHVTVKRRPSQSSRSRKNSGDSKDSAPKQRKESTGHVKDALIKMEVRPDLSLKPKRKASYESLSDDGESKSDSSHKRSGSGRILTKKKRTQKIHQHATPSEHEIFSSPDVVMSEANDLTPVATAVEQIDVQMTERPESTENSTERKERDITEPKPSLSSSSSSSSVHHQETEDDHEREKEIRKKIKRLNKPVADSLTLAQMFDRCSRMETALAFMHLQVAKELGELSSEDENDSKRRKKSGRKHHPSPSLLATPSPSDRASSPESVAVASPSTCDFATPTGEVLPVSEASCIMPLIVELEREIRQFRQAYAAKMTLVDS